MTLRSRGSLSLPGVHNDVGREEKTVEGMSRDHSARVSILLGMVVLIGMLNLAFSGSCPAAIKTENAIVTAPQKPIEMKQQVQGQVMPPVPVESKAHVLQKYHVIISTDCSAYQDWQSQVFVYSHRKAGFPGRVTRLVACKDPNWQPPKSSAPNYEVIVTPTFDPKGKDRYAPRNRPHSLMWLFKNRADRIASDEIVFLMDPDQVILHSWEAGPVEKGKPIAAGYGQGTQYLKWAEEYCDNKCGVDKLTQKQKQNLAIGAPYIIHAEDLFRIVPEWTSILEAIRDDEAEDHKGGWISDMLAYSIATLKLDLVHERTPLMVSNPGVSSEPWELAQGIPRPPLFAMHFCQKIAFEGYEWSKHQHHGYKFDDCNAALFPEAQGDAATWVLNHAFHSLGLSADVDRETTKSYRNAWAYIHTVLFSNEAFRSWRAEFCPSGPTI